MNQAGFARTTERQTYPSVNCEMSLGAAMAMVENILKEKEFRAEHPELEGSRLAGFRFENFTKEDDRVALHKNIVLYYTFMKQSGSSRSSRELINVRAICSIHKSSYDGWNCGEIVFYVGGESVLAFECKLNGNEWYVRRTN